MSKLLTGGGKLIDLCNQAIRDIDVFGFLKKKFTGVAILETVLTLPIILYTILFSIELIRMGLAQVAVDSITKELTFYLMANGKIKKDPVDAIFEKHRPLGIPIGNFRYNICMYANFHTDDNKGLMDISPYGGSSIHWVGEDYNSPRPTKSPTDRAQPANYGRGGTGSQATLLKYQGTVGPIENAKELLEGDTPSSGYIFILTVALNFPFSSPFVKKLFNGGTNTNREGVYILWARGSGIIN